MANIGRNYVNEKYGRDKRNHPQNKYLIPSFFLEIDFILYVCNSLHPLYLCTRVCTTTIYFLNQMLLLVSSFR